MQTTGTDTKQALLDIFQAAFSKTQNESRKQAWNQLLEAEIPTTRMEDWRYTRPSFLSKNTYNISKETSLRSVEEYVLDNSYYLLVIENGLFHKELSVLPAAVEVTDTLPAHAKGFKADKNFFTLLNESFFTTGVHLHVGKGIQLDKPLQLLHITTGNYACTVKHHIQLDEGASAGMIFTFHSTQAGSFTNVGIQGTCAENAHLNACLLQTDAHNNALYTHAYMHLANNSTAALHTFSSGNAWIRNDVHMAIDGSGSEANLYGISLPGTTQHIDNHTRIDHLKPHSQSNELYKSVLSGKSSVVFNGKVFVQKDAQKTNAYQRNASVLLSDDAVMNAKPELEIYADDVKCSHGSTTGQLDEMALFYLQSRGIGRDSAARMLVHAFLEEVSEKIPFTPAASKANQLIAASA